uniref:PGG domain-containing protein n=1 Tax=Brassica oleracea TaxID=3712 RepID=A0A3P6ERK3_BRAOL|nr:unnamed protein product [Brassica oleracea]
MDPRLKQAAESGSIDELYTLIDENPYILVNIDAVPFVTTPLHVAAAPGNIPFAKEMLNLKPSFARKLNTKGYSPLHLAFNMDQNEFVRRMIWLDGGLARVKGRNGITPFHLLAQKGNADLVARCLRGSPECIQDESVDRQNALHLAVKHDRFEVLQQAVRLLLECRLVKRNDVNGDGLTFLDILRRNQERREEAGGSQGPGEEEDLDLSNTSDEARGVFLIVCTLIITATYQTALQPPGGVHQPEEDVNAGSAVMKQTFFILLWVSNTVGFCCAILYTFCLLPLGMFASWFFWIGGSLCISYALAIAVISPHPLVFISTTFAFFLLAVVCSLSLV